MNTETVSFDPAAHSVDAIQRAAFRLSDRASFEVVVAESAIAVTVVPLAEEGDLAGLIAELRSEVLDQVLRERIRAETADVRNLVLALAFSKTGLAEIDE
jgi:His-Xaa-Ser system protein HxsD